jgi:HAD superfamily hydrolase (TIGR01509 family)
MDKKAAIFDELVHTEGILPYPAVPEFVMAVAQRYPVALATGSRRHEAEFLLETAGIRPHFEAIISADDVERGKPDPESFQKALAALNNGGKRTSAIKPEECAVIEDSKHGIVSAHAAGMKCVAVSTSHPAFELSGADLVVSSLASLKITQIEDLFATPLPQPVPMPHPQN